MRQPHVYLCRGLVVHGTPIEKDEFEELTGSASGRRTGEVHFLRDVTVLGERGPIVEVAFMVLDVAAVGGIGRGHVGMVHMPASLEGGR